MTQRLTVEATVLPWQTQGDTLAAVRSWPGETARIWTLKVVRGATRNPTIAAIVASGSAVREVEQSDDLDLVMVYRTRRPDLPRAPIDVDLRLYEQAEVLRKLKDGHDYLSWTIRYGRVLFERDAWWTQLTADWNDRLRLPSVAEARERADKAGRLYNEVLAIGDDAAAAEVRLSILTFLARAALSSAGVFPKSRPELANQLRTVDKHALADRLSDALAHRYG